MVTSDDSPVFIDTNVLVYANIPAYPLHQLALQTPKFLNKTNFSFNLMIY